MTNYVITFARSARKELEVLDSSVVKRIFSKIEGLGEHPRPAGCSKLQGEDKLWRIRIGNYRVIYVVDDLRKQVDIVTVKHWKDAYR